jgi:MATE family multidrug resistance protein
MSIVFFFALAMNIFPEEIASIFTKDQLTKDIIVDLLPWLSCFVMLDSIHGVQSGNVRALGKQAIVSLLTLLLYYIYGIPMALLLAFYFS